MSATVPILFNHDRSYPPLGYVEATDDGRLIVRLLDDSQITRATLFRILGECGLRILEVDGEYVRRVEITEFSLPPGRV